jgi:hypothetical protein
MEEKLRMPVSQRVYGEVIYWITVVAAIVCMVGPDESTLLICGDFRG